MEVLTEKGWTDIHDINNKNKAVYVWTLKVDYRFENGRVERGNFPEFIINESEFDEFYEEAMHSFNLTFGTKFTEEEEFKSLIRITEGFTISAMKSPGNYFVTLYYSFNGINYYTKNLVS